MKKILTIIISVVVVVLIGITFGLGALPAAYLPSDPIYAKFVGNFYQIVWQYRDSYMMLRGLIMNIGIFFLLCVVGALSLVTLIPFKIRYVGDAILSIALVALGILFFFVPTFFFMRYDGVEMSYSLGGGLIAMGVLTIVAGVLNAIKTIFLIQEKNALKKAK